MNRTTITAPSRWTHFHFERSAASRLLLQIAKVIVWLLALVLALLVWQAANR